MQTCMSDPAIGGSWVCGFTQSHFAVEVRHSSCSHFREQRPLTCQLAAWWMYCNIARMHTSCFMREQSSVRVVKRKYRQSSMAEILIR